MRLLFISTLILLTPSHSKFYDAKTPVSVLEEEYAKHSFIGIYGWPNSGLNWMHELMRFTPDVSTMIEGCMRVAGKDVEKKCTATQYNGIPRVKSAVQKLHPNIMCTLPEKDKDLQTTMDEVFNEWIRLYWNVDYTYVVENSAHLMVKIPLIKESAKKFADQKYVLAIKHPLCVETSYTGDWSRAVREGKLNTAMMDLEVMVDVDGAKKSPRYYGDVTCDGYQSARGMSWIQGMNTLYDQLQADSKWSKEHVRIVHYEDFQSRPVQVCQNVYKFLFLENRPASLKKFVTNSSSPYFWGESDIEKACATLFKKSTTRRNLRTTSSHEYGNSHRRLRKHIITRGYHIQPTEFPYDPVLINASCSIAFSTFAIGYPSFSDTAKAKLDAMSAKTSPFGYSLDFQNFYVKDEKFGAWDVMLN